jgi:prevent-host-death family protein
MERTMRKIGVHELKVKTSEIMRNVRLRRGSYIITYRGRPVGLLSPLEGQERSQASSSESAAWDELTRLGKEIGQGWPAGTSSTDILSRIRR